jgi:DNA-binding GntR family transcriptional regulator
MPMVQQPRARRGGARGGGARGGGRNDGLPSSEHVYRRLKDRIISGTLAPDTRLIELSIAAEFGVSRTPVREALKRLAAENLVLHDPARGMVVHAPDADEIEDVFVVREALDGLAARLAAHRVTPSELARLRLIVDSMADAVANDRHEQIVVANLRFHDVIYSAAGNPMLERVASDLRDYVRRFSTLPFASPDRVQQVLAEHEAILGALEKHDPAAAERASDSHLANAREYLVQMELQEFAKHALG